MKLGNYLITVQNLPNNSICIASYNALLAYVFVYNSTRVSTASYNTTVAPAIGSRASYKTMSIKFGDHDEDSPLDLLLCTGRYGPFYNVSTLDQFYSALRTGNEGIRDYLLANPVW